jgi:hypothetical protein
MSMALPEVKMSGLQIKQLVGELVREAVRDNMALIAHQIVNKLEQTASHV